MNIARYLSTIQQKNSAALFSTAKRKIKRNGERAKAKNEPKHSLNDPRVIRSIVKRLCKKTNLYDFESAISGPLFGLQSSGMRNRMTIFEQPKMK